MKFPNDWIFWFVSLRFNGYFFIVCDNSQGRTHVIITSIETWKACVKSWKRDQTSSSRKKRTHITNGLVKFYSMFIFSVQSLTTTEGYTKIPFSSHARIYIYKMSSHFGNRQHCVYCALQSAKQVCDTHHIPFLKNIEKLSNIWQTSILPSHPIPFHLISLAISDFKE